MDRGARARRADGQGGGADIIAVDIAGKLPRCVPYDPATPEDLDETVKLVEETGRRILASVVDTRDSEAMNAAVETGVSELGRLDIIVANAGVSAPQAWDDISPDDFRDVMDINVTGTWNTVMAGAQKIIDGGRGGSVILISSAAGIKLQPFMIHYTASKHAVTGMARAFAAELGKHSIRVNSVHPGPVITDMGTGDMVTALGKAMETNPQLSHMMTPFLPTWAVEPEDIADTVSWLACDDSKYITASAISIDQAQPTTERAAFVPGTPPDPRPPCRTNRGPATRRSDHTGSGAPGPAVPRCRGDRISGNVLVEVGDLDQQRAAQPLGRRGGAHTGDLETDRRVDFVAPRRTGQRQVAFVGTVERQSARLAHRGHQRHQGRALPPCPPPRSDS